jgi:hypothetical protein
MPDMLVSIDTGSAPVAGHAQDFRGCVGAGAVDRSRMLGDECKPVVDHILIADMPGQRSNDRIADQGDDAAAQTELMPSG